MKCKDCGEDKDEKLFRVHRRKTKRGITKEYQYKTCKPCLVKQHREWVTPEKLKRYAESSKRKRRSRKIWAIDYKGGVCKHCNTVVHEAAFDFHHLNPKEKDMDVGLMLTRSEEDIVKELDKCILLCANCHRIHHYDE